MGWGLVGLGFQAKMLQAWMILPALAIGYLVAAPVRLRRRFWQLGVAGLVMLAVSLSWIALYTFTPAKDRPYVDGSASNSAIAMVFGYNGLEPFGMNVPGTITPGKGTASAGGGRSGTGGSAAQPPAGFPGGSGTQAGSGSPGSRAGSASSGPAGGSGSPASPAGTGSYGRGNTSNGAPSLTGAAGGGFGTGWTKLLGSQYAPQIGWLYSLALLALVFGLAWTRRARRNDRVRAGFVMWGTWLLTVGLVFSKMAMIPHTAYMASLAPPAAALPAAGIVMFWRTYRAGGWRGWILPVAVAAEVAWALFVWRGYGSFLPWLRTALVVAGAVAVIVMVAARLSRRVQARIVTAGLAAGVAAMLAAPAAWAASVLDTKYGGNSFNASARPAGGMSGFSGGSAPPGASSRPGLADATVTVSQARLPAEAVPAAGFWVPPSR